ncbi:hypothetical protein [Gillisia sp. Hel_I_86]|uniref:hypothetical protein n=1 Tax=Gillisia sp. Hel_I_86 TaxID=1249981 RepID=UPI0021BD6578|nr:hypothetical protein [Gillisia sp. Hel_I_86]
MDIEKSVSRAGGKAQLKTYRKIAGNLKPDCAQFEELETFARLGIHLAKKTSKNN